MKRRLKERFGLTERELERILIQRKRKQIRKVEIKVSKRFRFAAIGDTHLGSKKEKLEQLHAFYDLVAKEGINTVLHAGDILEGQGVYRGQEYEIHTFGADNQIDYVVKWYPRKKGVKTYFITGNHDYVYFQKIGLDVGAKIAEKRDDMIYLGPFFGEIKIGGEKIWLVHPDGGMPYALTYRAQKYVEQISGGTKPRILLLGHLHTMYHFDYRNIFVFGVGCFQGQTTFILRKGINPVIGGWIIEIGIAGDKKRSIVEITPKFKKFY